MSERVTLVLEDGISELMTSLSGGERKRGQWLSDLVRGIHDQGQLAAASDFETFKFAFAGLTGQVKTQEGRLLNVERQLSALIAQSGLQK